MYLVIIWALVLFKGFWIKNHHIRPPHDCNTPHQLRTVNTVDRNLSVAQVRAEQCLHVLQSSIQYHNIPPRSIHLQTCSDID